MLPATSSEGAQPRHGIPDVLNRHRPADNLNHPLAGRPKA
jgi:hypothetical protein